MSFSFPRLLVVTSASVLAAAASAYPVAVDATPYPAGASGHDISWPQCGGPLPAGGEVSVVGVNDGQPYTVNPCFAEEWRWAAPSESASVYINLDRSASDLAAHGGSAYTDGWAAAAFSASVVGSQGAHPAMWWLDVETTGDWSCGVTCHRDADADVVRGALDFLHSQGAPVGIYSNPQQWAIIAGGYAPGAPVWTTDYDDSHPWTHCGAGDSFAGGSVALVQLFPAAYDTDYVCSAPNGVTGASQASSAVTPLSSAPTGLAHESGFSALVTRGADGSLFHDWNIDGVTVWNRSRVSPPGSATSAPIVIRAPSSTLITAEAASHSLQFYWNIDGSPAWYGSQIDGGGKAYSAPAAMRGPNSTLVAVQGPNHSLSFYWNIDGQGPWNFVQIDGNGTAYSAPTIAREANATLVTVEGPNHSLSFYWNPDGDGRWYFTQISASGTAYSAPVMARQANGTLVAVQGPKNSLSFYWNSDDQASWYFVPIDGSGKAYSTPAMVRQSGGTLVAVQGPKNSLSFYWNVDDQASWYFAPIDGSGKAYSAPAMARQSDGTLVAVQGPKNSLSFYWNADRAVGWPKVTAAGVGSTRAFG